MRNFRCEYINSYKSMQNWRKIGVKRCGHVVETLENKGFLRGDDEK
ncbi:MAG: hypothetical protein IJ324_13500 [Lachnospiraceae bacterium]|nr:hypothetical protein [Lachnospiraceae bacterium]MBQ8233604.1 hypothetical protein [Lachnospiraceae bacterium]